MEPDILNHRNRNHLRKTVLSVWISTVFIVIASIFTACSPAVPSNPELTEPTAPGIPPEPTNPISVPTQVFEPGDRCSPVGQQQLIDASFAEYQAARSGNEDAILALTEWASIVSAEVSTACSGALFELSDPANLIELLDKLLAGGYVIYVRHTHTDRSRGDTDVRLGNCDTQRILSDRGRDEALLIRNAYQ